MCCNLSGFRGADSELDIAADLRTEDFGSAYARLSKVAKDQLEYRRKRLEELAQVDQVDPYISSPCLFCLDTFGKLPWRKSYEQVNVDARTLPVLQSS